MVTRTCLEQDLGRVCQYKTSASAVPDVHVYVSRVLYDTIKVKRQRRGIPSLDPDYKPDNMSTKVDRNDRYPKNEGDFEPYNRYWCAGKDHYDHKYQNINLNKNYTKQLPKDPSRSNHSVANWNRFLLYGRPQIGKTGVFFHKNA